MPVLIKDTPNNRHLEWRHRDPELILAGSGGKGNIKHQSLSCPRHQPSYSQLMRCSGCPMTETKRMSYLGSMLPFSEGEPGSLGMLNFRINNIYETYPKCLPSQILQPGAKTQIFLQHYPSVPVDTSSNLRHPSLFCHQWQWKPCRQQHHRKIVHWGWHSTPPAQKRRCFFVHNFEPLWVSSPRRTRNRCHAM